MNISKYFMFFILLFISFIFFSELNYVRADQDFICIDKTCKAYGEKSKLSNHNNLNSFYACYKKTLLCLNSGVENNSVSLNDAEKSFNFYFRLVEDGYYSLKLKLESNTIKQSSALTYEYLNVIKKSVDDINNFSNKISHGQVANLNKKMLSKMKLSVPIMEEYIARQAKMPIASNKTTTVKTTSVTQSNSEKQTESVNFPLPTVDSIAALQKNENFSITNENIYSAVAIILALLFISRRKRRGDKSLNKF